ncbi:phosphatidylinositol glycan, class P [Paragonimus westermani]|uniref:Phosphatidylinositol glycan, class P n=1 Tax=Paragonimus westermani TaxID=34504 RepID=A0A5J4NV24_9TREM|nr:phosphatidylinositol glycan, class P [Paragonimus westermani]
MVDIQNYEFQIPTPASNPGPLAERAMYGFIVYIVSYVCFGAYLVWAYLPHEWLHAIGITYLPHKVRCYALPLLMFVNVSSVSETFMVDGYSRREGVSMEMHRGNDPSPISAESKVDRQVIPPLTDLDPAWVMEQLYLRPSQLPRQND